MEAKTDAHSPQPTRHLGDLSFPVITMYEPVLFAYQISTSELIGPAVRYVLRRIRRCVARIVQSSSCSPAVWRCVPWPLDRRLAYNRFIVSLSNCRLSLSLSNYRKSFGTILSYRCRTTVPNLPIRYPTLMYAHPWVPQLSVFVFNNERTFFMRWRKKTQTVRAIQVSCHILQRWASRKSLISQLIVFVIVNVLLPYMPS